MEVRVVRRKNGLLLVEWQEGDLPKRAWVTPDMVLDDQESVAVVDNPSAGIPYGVEFWRLVEMAATPQDLDRELKRRGIWTAEDLRAHPNVVLSALQDVYGVDLAALYQAVSRLENDLNGG